MKNIKNKKHPKKIIAMDFEVEKILKSRTKNNKKEYLIKWVGYKRPTWEPESNVNNCEELLKKFLLQENGKKCTKNAKTTDESQKKLKNEKKIKPKNKKIGKIISTKKTFSSCEKVNKKKLPKTLKVYSALQEEEEFIPYDININEDKEKQPKNNDKVKSVEISQDDEINISLISNGKDKVSFDDLEGKEDKNEKSDKKQNDSTTSKSEMTFLNKKRKIDSRNEEIMEEREKGDDKINIKEIYSMRIPENSEEGIKLNIKYMKNNKIYIEEFDSNSGEISLQTLTKYYEIVLYDLLKGKNYSKTLSVKN